MNTRESTFAFLGASALAALFFAGRAAAESDWPEPAARSGVTLPGPGTLAARTDLGGIWVKEVEGLSNDSTGVMEGSLTWNFRLFGPIGIFGKHDLSRMWWDNISLLTFGHEVGARFLFGPVLVFEAAYLTHRIEYEWIDGDPWTVGGLNDHGAEVGMWARLEPHSRIRLQAHTFGRRFMEPRSDRSFSYVDQVVFGLGLRTTLKVFKKQFVEVEVEALRVYRRGRRRAGVEEVTWNTVGTFQWRSAIHERFGLQAGVTASTNWMCGMVPMLEYKRSMIDEPQAKFFAGFYFFI